MPDIGATLRETRMRQRIDITEVEAATKIRAKYLRALESEEWDLLPGPTFVKTFLRTYADYLGMDSRALVERYRQEVERPSGEPFPGTLRPRRERRQRLLTPAVLVAAGVVALLAVLVVLTRGGGSGKKAPVHAASPTATP